MQTKAYDYSLYDFQIEFEDGVAIVEFNDSHRHNMWSMPRMAQLIQLLNQFNQDDTVLAVLLYSGKGRSFGVGGSFHETSTFTGGNEVDVWIDHVTDLYIAALQLRCPLIVAIAGYAIGIGLQIALTADYRIGSDCCVLKMPEFQLGIACTFGGYMLEKVVGRSVMQNMLMSCGEWSADKALNDSLLHQMVSAQFLRDAAVEHAKRMANFTVAGFRSTKRYLNHDFIIGLEQTRIIGKEAHRSAFSAGEAQNRMKVVIGKLSNSI
ncbi:enoyl-CoA hydratase/isomerase family protein [Glaciimonas immobilis]|uniref:Carboxymethylproline synthase n=1 Tax=Glaciimonas immobilis TaxID=728004 RepID=A0A840RVF4_9BURK|nr:enoyl-CoA hydratase/isomerase family protein [Glaciimonas immobilis]KAF3996237.1 enoyl-CoA hydratase/isomerase family protein [Glaciimonas immobilis]MBB5202607.1 carboxymethylproline synthase [Glaciimonas immobilis]